MGRGGGGEEREAEGPLAVKEGLLCIYGAGLIDFKDCVVNGVLVDSQHVRALRARLALEAWDECLALA